jgi:glycosyltransferase involved in cell wall biosynthesis
MPDRRVLLVTSESFPPIYPSIGEIYGRLLPQRGYAVDTVFTDASSPGQSADAWPGRPPLARIPSTRGMLGPGLVGGQVQRRAALAGIRSAVARNAYDIVQVRDDPWLGAMFAAACRRSRTPLVFQLSHLKEEELQLQARQGVYGPPLLNRFKAAVALRLRRRASDRAALVLAISDEMREYLRSRNVRARIEVLPEGADAGLLTAAGAVSGLRARLGFGTEPVLVYVGTVSRTRRPEFLVKVLQRVRKDHPSARLLIVGHTSHRQDWAALEHSIAEANLGSAVVVTGPVAASDVPGYIVNAQVGLSPLPADEVFRMNSPVKLFEYLALGVPAVASDTPEQAAVIGASGAGYAVSYSVEAFATAIGRLLDDPADASARGRAGRDFVRRERTFDVLADRLAGIYAELVTPTASLMSAR